MTRSARTYLGLAILAIGVVAAFAFYIDRMTPPTRGVDLLTHVVFFPMVYPLAPLFMDTAFDLGWMAYLTYPVIAVSLALFTGQRHPVALTALALLTCYLLPWLGQPLTVMGYQSGIALEALIGSDLLAAIAMGAIPITGALALMAPERPAGGVLLLVCALVTLLCLAASASADGFLSDLGSLAWGGYATLIAALAGLAFGAGMAGAGRR